MDTVQYIVTGLYIIIVTAEYKIANDDFTLVSQMHRYLTK